MPQFPVMDFTIALGGGIFCLGVLGFLTRRSGLVALMCLELMLNGVNVCLVGFSRAHGNAHGGSLLLFIFLVAAAEVAVALSLLVALFRKTGTVYLDEFRELKG